MRLLASALVLIALGHTARAQGVTVTQAWSRATPPGAPTAAIYVDVTASAPDRLTAASTPAAGMAMVHESQMMAGVMQMRDVEGGLAVTPSQPIHMAPGGYHIMLMGLTHPLRQGDHIPLTLTFERAGTVQADAIVAGAGASQPPAR